MKRLAINQAASDVADLVAETLATLGERVVLVAVVREERGESPVHPVSLRAETCGVIQVHESEIILAIQLCRVAQVEYLVMVCPDDAFGSSPASAKMGSLVLSREGHSPASLAAELVGHLDAAARTGRPMLWAQVVQGERVWRESGQPDKKVNDSSDQVEAPKD